MDNQEKQLDDVTNQTPDNGEEATDFSFIQETIKDENPTPKTKGRRILGIGLLGLVFGICTSIGYCAVKPWAMNTFQTNKTKVELSDDQHTDQTTDSRVLTVTKDNLEQTYNQMHAVGKEAAKSIAVVTGAKAGETWVESQESKGTAGIIIADNGQDTLILVSANVCKSAEDYRVTFYDGSNYQGQLKSKDEHFGYAVIGVPDVKIGQSVKNYIKVATLGNSYGVNEGDAVIAVGSQFGEEDDMGYGVVSSVDNTVNITDGSYTLITTDIPCATDGSGALINLSGEVIGLMNSSLSQEENYATSNAYAISRIKSMIERLSNGLPVPYIGINGTDVTEEISEEQGLPQGVYVVGVETDSAGMNAGIKSGDIITNVNGKEIMNLNEYHMQVMKSRVGDKIKIAGKRLGANEYVDIEFNVTLGDK